MARAGTNFIVDFVVLVAFLVSVWTAVVVRFIFPSGVDSAGWLLWGWNYDAWCNIAIGSLIVTTLLILLHLILHWGWLVAFVTTRIARRTRRPLKLSDGAKTIAGVITLSVALTILGSFLIAAQVSITDPGDSPADVVMESHQE
jgi:hypothetical protein